MTAKEYLSRISRQNFILKQTAHERPEIRSDILTIRASSLAEHVSGSKKSDVADKYIRLEQYMDKVNHEWDILINMRMEAKAMIKALPDPQHQAVLYARYINGLRWEAIAVEMGYSWKGVFKIHGQALQAFEQVHHDALASKGS